MQSPTSIRLLSTLHLIHNQYGLRHDDYERYRRHCSKKLTRLRTSLNVHHGKGTRFERQALDDPELFLKHASQDTKASSEYLLMFIYEIERYWSAAMENKEGSKDVPRKKFQAVKKLRRASQMALALQALVTSDKTAGFVDARSMLEVQVYAAHMTGLWKFEVQDWQSALDSFASARTVYEKLAETGSAEEEALCHARLDEIEPLLRYSVYQLQRRGVHLGGDAQSLEEIIQLRTQSAMSEMLQSKLDQIRESKSEVQQEIQWRSKQFAIKQTKVALPLMKVQELERGLAATDMTFDNALELYGQMLAAYQEAHAAAEEAVRSDALAAAKVQSSRSELTTDRLNTISAYVAFNKLSANIRRDWTMAVVVRSFIAKHWSDLELVPMQSGMASMKVLDGKAFQKAKPLDAARLFDDMAQSIHEMKELYGLKEDPAFMSESSALIALFNSYKCCYLAMQHATVSEMTEANELYNRALVHCRSALRELASVKAADSNPLFQKLAVKENLQSNEAFLARKVITSIAESALPKPSGALSSNLNQYLPCIPMKDGKPWITALPPALEPIPMKPVFFDLAQYKLEDAQPLDELEERIQKSEAGGATGLVKGLLGSWWK